MKAVVCGSAFGQVYMEAFRLPGAPFEFAGILGKGSARSQGCARHYGVPLFTDVADLPAEIQAACVVVRGGLLGGDGTELAKKLMSRGIHVLQEHPLHHDELAECLRHARRHQVVYHLNSFYVHLKPVRRFLAAAREALRWQRPLYVDAASGFQVAYALLDIVASALGRVRPWRFEAASSLAHDPACPPGPFRSLDGHFGGLPVTLRIQHQLDPTDPDGHSHLLHRVTLGLEGGNLTLVETHGPIVWSARPDIPRQVHDGTAPPLFSTDLAHADHQPSSKLLDFPRGPDFRSMYTVLWPEAVVMALVDLHRAIAEREDSLPRGQYHLTLCRVWQDIAAILGPPAHRRDPSLRPLPPEGLSALAAAVTAIGSTPMAR